MVEVQCPCCKGWNEDEHIMIATEIRCPTCNGDGVDRLQQYSNNGRMTIYRVLCRSCGGIGKVPVKDWQ